MAVYQFSALGEFFDDPRTHENSVINPHPEENCRKPRGEHGEVTNQECGKGGAEE